jgi:hypothetical protein
MYLNPNPSSYRFAIDEQLSMNNRVVHGSHFRAIFGSFFISFLISFLKNEHQNEIENEHKNDHF